MHEAFSDKTAVVDHPQPYCMQTILQEGQAIELKLEKADNPLTHGTLGDIGLATSVVGPSEFPLTILIQPFDRTALTGIEATSVRVFRWDSVSGSLKPIWNSGINVDLGFVWTKIRRIAPTPHHRGGANTSESLGESRYHARSWRVYPVVSVAAECVS